MCGIAGFIQSGNKNLFNFSNIQPMVNALIHRGPDSYGVWEEREGSGGCILRLLYFG